MLILTFLNDGTSETDEIGNYTVQVRINHKIIHTAVIEGFERRRGWKALVTELVKETDPQAVSNPRSP